MAKSELLEEEGRSSIQQRPAHPLAPSNNFDQLALMQRFEHLTGADSANLLNFGSSDWLSVCDYREGLECRSREPLWASRKLSALDDFSELGTREDLPSAGDFHQLHTMPVFVVVQADFLERSGYVFR